MNLAQARQQWPQLNDYTDEELLDIAAQQNGVSHGDPRYGRLQQEFLGYDRSAGEITKDTGLQLGQGLLGLGKSVASIFGAYDNPVAQRLGGFSQELEGYKSQGLQNQQAGAQINSQIAAQESAARGDDSLGRFLSGAGAQVQNYWNAPGLLAQDVVTNAPQLVAGGVAGKGLNLAARGLGFGVEAASKAGVAGGIGSNAVLQAADVGGETYARAIKAGATPEQASALANEAAIKAGGVSLGISMVPGASAIERRIAGGAPGRTFGLGRVGTTARVTGTEMGSEAIEEGFGQFAGNQSVQRVDPNVDLMGGVGQAATQGAAAAGPVSGFVGLTTPIQRALPRTETGELDVTGSAGPAAPGAQVVPAPVMSRNLDVPAATRRGLDPLNERSSPWSPPAPQPPDPLMVDSNGVVMPFQTPEQLAAMDAARSTQNPATPASMVDIAGPVFERTAPDFTSLVEPRNELPPDPFAGQTPLRSPVPVEAPVAPPAPQTPAPLMVDANGVVMPFQTPEQLAAMDAARGAQAAQQAEQSKPLQERKATKGDILKAIAELKRSYVKKDGELANNHGGIAMRKILEAEDPAAAIREMHEDGSGARDEFLDNLHERLTGQTVFDWREAQQAAADTNSAGFVPETQENIFAQIEAVKQGRKKAIVLGEQEAKTVGRVKGLSRAVATDPTTGETAVVMAPDRAVVQRAVARTQEVGLKQAMGEALAVANPTLTSQATPGTPVAAVQQVDNQSGAVLGEEIVTPADLPNVQPIPGTTQQVVPADQPTKQRRAAAAATPVNPVNSEPAAPATTKKAKPPKLGRRPSAELVEIAENTKDQDELTEARYEMYKRWAEDTDEGVSEAYLTDKKNRSELSPEEKASFKARYDAELKAKQIKTGQKLGKKFGSVKLRQASDAQKPALSAEQVNTQLDDIKRTTPAAADIEVAQSLADEGLDTEFPAGTNVAGVTYPDGRIVLFADGLTSAADVTRTVFHELFHRGVAHTPDYVRALRDIASRDPWVRAEANKWKLTPDGQRNARTNDAAELDAIAIEEALARMSERIQGGAGTGSQSRNAMVRTLSNWMASAADALGMKSLARWLRRQSFTEAEKFVMDVVRAVPETDGDPAGGRALAPVRARVADATADANTPEPPVLKPLSAATKLVAAAQAQTSGREINELLLKTMTVRQIVEQFGKKLPALAEWVEALFERSSHASRLAAKADRVALQWEKSVKNKAERQALADVLLRASVSELSLDNVSPEYLATLDATERAEHAALRQKLAALPKEAQEARRQALAVLAEQWQYTHDSLVSFIKHTVADPDLRRLRIQQLDEQMGRSRGDYFPLSRFGDRIVIGRGAAKDGRDVVSFHETAAGADAEVKRLKAGGVKKIDVTLRTERDPRQRATTGFMGDLHALVDQSEADSDAKESMHEALQQLYLKSLPEMSGAKHMIRRESVEGYSVDALRVFADAVTRGARYASHLDYAPRIQAAMESAEDETRPSQRRTIAVVIARKDGQAPLVEIVPVGTQRYDRMSQLMDDGYTVDSFNSVPESVRERMAGKIQGATDAQLDGYVSQAETVAGRGTEGVEDKRAAKALYNHMIGLQRNEEDPSKIVEVLGQVGYTWFLGFTPAFWMMNTMQNPMIGIPHLGAKYGVGKASLEWGTAMRWFGSVRMGKLLTDSKTPFSVDWLKQAIVDQKITGVSKQELDMLQALEDHQVLDFTQAMDLSRIGQASDGKWNKFMRLAAAGAHHTEVFNRVTFALAAYRLALKSSGSVTHEEAVRRAEDDVAAVHFDYSAANKPELMRGKARLVFMFQQYRQHMLYWWGKTVKDAVKGETPEERRRAYKAAFLMGTTNALFAGALGMPFVGTIAFLMNMFAPDDDDGVPFDFDRWLTEAATEATGSEKAGQVMARGIFNAMGMNIGQRIGQGDLMPFLNEGSARFERNADDKMRAYLFDLAGPLGSIALGVARSSEAFARGDTVAGLAHTTPKAVSDILKAIELSNEGVKNGRGQVLASQEAFDGADVFLQAAGVAPADVASIKADRGRVIEIDNAFKDKTRRLMGSFTEAWMRQDRAGVAEALAEIQDYNRKIATGKFRDRSLLIDGRKLESAIRDRQQKALILALTGGTADSKRQMMIALRMSGLINAVTPDSMQQNAMDLPGLPGLN